MKYNDNNRKYTIKVSNQSLKRLRGRDDGEEMNFSGGRAKPSQAKREARRVYPGLAY
jgi:hypothetical protein